MYQTEENEGERKDSYKVNFKDSMRSIIAWFKKPNSVQLRYL